MVLLVLLLLVILSLVRSECPSACSGHGKCSEFDSCVCYRNWMANDCSQRVCQFGLAHVDSPIGDLDASGGLLTNFKDGTGAIQKPVLNHSQIFPYGTYEQFPRLLNFVNLVATDGDKTSTTGGHAVIGNAGHAYTECSNKGICDREAGECSCFPGYEGSACQRASCPATKEGMCSGHGVCKSIKELAEDDHNNHYLLWDADVTMGCSCDAGWTGADCSDRSCKYGFDPLHYDNENTVRYSNFTFTIYQIDAAPKSYEGTYSLRFYDAFGEDWETDPIDIASHASGTGTVLTDCDTIRKAMERIPNDVIPPGTMKCQALRDTAFKAQYQTNGGGAVADYDLPANFATHVSYTLAFPNNPGVLKQPEFNFYLDGSRPSAYTTGGSNNGLQSWVYANGFQGEEFDFAPDYCENVKGELVHNANLWELNVDNAALFKKCLGEADNNTATTAVDIYDWDYGTPRNPHLIKLVDRSYKQNGYWTPATALCNTTTETLSGNNNLYSVFGAGSCLNSNPPGFYVVTFFAVDTSSNDIATWNTKTPTELSTITGKFVLFQQVGLDYDDRGTNNGGKVFFDIFTSKGTMQSVSSYIHAYNYMNGGAANTKHSNKMYTVLDLDEDSDVVSGAATADRYDVSCEYSLNADGTFKYTYGRNNHHGVGREQQLECLNKGDTVFFLNVQVPEGYATTEGDGYSLSDLSDIFPSNWTTTGDAKAYNYNPMYLNHYTVEKVGRKEAMTLNPNPHQSEIQLETLNEIVLNQNLNHNWMRLDHQSSHGTDDANNHAVFNIGKMLTAAKIYKFKMAPADKLTATYANQCSGRGICNSQEGLCECFTGYTGDACSMQSALAE